LFLAVILRKDEKPTASFQKGHLLIEGEIHHDGRRSEWGNDETSSSLEVCCAVKHEVEEARKGGEKKNRC